MGERERDDFDDYLAHPEWFAVVPMCTGPEWPMELRINPPLLITRKSVLVVLPIRGGFADGKA